MMSSLRGFKQKLSAISRLWEQADYDSALTEVESLLKFWPGNPHLHVFWANLVQLQEHPQYGLDDARQALQRAVDLERGSPAAAIELGHFLDSVDDDPQAASKAYAEGVAVARQLLIDGLIGRAKVLRQLGKTREFGRCLQEARLLAQNHAGPKRSRGTGPGADYAEQIEELLSEGLAGHPA